MSFDQWLSLLAIAVPVMAGMSAWLFRIDRLVTKVVTKMETIPDLWSRVNRHGDQIHELDKRVTRIEAKHGEAE